MLKKTEHLWKSIIHDGDTVSVHRPNFYATRFQKFMRDKVFRKMPAPPTLRLVSIIQWKTNIVTTVQERQVCSVQS